MLKTKIRIFIVSVIVLLNFHIIPSYSHASLNVSDPSGFIEERYEDYIYISSINGFASSSKEYYFLMGAPGRVKINLNGFGAGVFRVFAENSYGRYVGATNPYNKEDSKTLDLDLSPGRYKVKIAQTTFSFFNGFMFYTLTINHPQPAPIIESLIPANGSIVSSVVKLGVYHNEEIAENPLISSVDILIDNNLIETLMFSPFEYNWDTSVWPNQYHTIEYRAYDVLGRYYPLAINVKVENSESQTSTDSFHYSIIPLWSLMPGPYKEYSFEMAIDGTVNVLLSGENARCVSFSLYDESENRVGVSRDDFTDYRNFRSLNIFLKKGKYFVRVRQFMHGIFDRLVYSLTINHPSADLSILRDLSASSKIIDPSGDGEVKAVGFSYGLLDDAYVLIKLESPDRGLLKTIQPISFQAKGIYNISNTWNGLLDDEKISGEGIYFFVIELYDKEDKNFLEKQSIPVEVKYHLDY